MRLQETHPQRTERENGPISGEIGSSGHCVVTASNAGNPASRGLQGEKKPTREGVGFLVLVVESGPQLQLILSTPG